MPIPRFEVPAGVVDGVNRLFQVSQPYLPLTVAVFLNGQLKERSLEDGWVELDPSDGWVELKEAPRSFGNVDVVQVFYLDTSPTLPESEVTRMSGSIMLVEEVGGELAVQASVVAELVVGADDLVGEVMVPVMVVGAVTERELVSGLIVEVC